MSGDWIAAVAARLLRDETFAATVAPAVADLQFEARSSGPGTLARSYLGVARGVALAGLADLRGDVVTAFAGDTIRHVWLRALAIYAAFAVIGVWLMLGRVMLESGIGRNWPEPQRGWRDVALVLMVALVSLAFNRVPRPKRVRTS